MQVSIDHTHSLASGEWHNLGRLAFCVSGFQNRLADVLDLRAGQLTIALNGVVAGTVDVPVRQKQSRLGENSVIHAILTRTQACVTVHSWVYGPLWAYALPSFLLIIIWSNFLHHSWGATSVFGVEIFVITVDRDQPFAHRVGNVIGVTSEIR